jgi:hypothetical protein
MTPESDSASNNSRSPTDVLGCLSIVLLSLFATACSGSDEQPAQSDAGSDAGPRPSGKGGADAGGGQGGSGGGTSTGPASDAGAALPMMTITCTETAPTTPVLCGGEVCQAPAQFAGNPCIVPCCIMQGDQEVCASRSTAMSFTTECALPAVPDPQCPEVNAPGTPLATAMGVFGGLFQGCCDANQHKCGIISGIRPGCVTESLLVTLPSDAPACSEAPDDGGTDMDGG